MKTKDKTCEIDEIPHRVPTLLGSVPGKAKLAFAALRASPAVLSMIGPSLKTREKFLLSKSSSPFLAWANTPCKEHLL